MTDLDAEYLNHQYLYVPWVDGVETHNLGKALAIVLADHYRAPLTVLCPQKSNALHHPELAKRAIVTERSGGVQDGGVVLAWCPSFKLMDKAYHLPKSVLVLAEWPTEDFSAWARLVGAYNVVTQTSMDAGLDEVGRKALEGVMFEGYKGWHDDIASRMTKSHLAELNDVGQYDRNIVLQYARQQRGSSSLDRLEKILNEFDASRTK